MATIAFALGDGYARRIRSSAKDWDKKKELLGGILLEFYLLTTYSERGERHDRLTKKERARCIAEIGYALGAAKSPMDFFAAASQIQIELSYGPRSDGKRP